VLFKHKVREAGSRLCANHRAKTVLTKVAFFATLVVLLLGMSWTLHSFANNTFIGHRLSGYVLWVQQLPVQRVEIWETLHQAVSITSLDRSRSVTIVGARPPCSCIQMDGLPMTLQPGDTREIQLSFDTSGWKSGRSTMQIPLMLDVPAPEHKIELSFSASK